MFVLDTLQPSSSIQLKSVIYAGYSWYIPYVLEVQVGLIFVSYLSYLDLKSLRPSLGI